MHQATYARRVLLAIEHDDGSAEVYEVGAAKVDMKLAEFMGTDPPLITLEVRGYYAHVRHVPASDYFEEQPEIAPPARALNP